MKLNEVILVEAKDEYVVQAFGHKIANVAQLQSKTDAQKKKQTLEFVRKNLVPLDPTPNQKYLVWIAKLYADGNLAPEDFYKVPEELRLFQKVQPKLAQKDLMQYKTLPDLAQALLPFQDEGAQLSNKELARKERQELFAKGEAEEIMRTDSYIVVSPKTYKASCELGKGTKWCTTSGATMFQHYNKQGTLYIIYTDKVPGAPFQLLFPYNPISRSVQFANAVDRYTSLKIIRDNFPEFRKYLLDKSGKIDPVQLATLYIEDSGDFLDLLTADELQERVTAKLSRENHVELLELALQRDSRSSVYSKSNADYLKRFVWLATGNEQLKKADLEALGKQLGVYGNVDKNTSESIAAIDTQSAFQKWAAIYGLSGKTDSVILNGGIGLINGHAWSAAGIYGSSKTEKKKLKIPTVFSKDFKKLTPEWKLKTLVSNLSGRIYVPVNAWKKVGKSEKMISKLALVDNRYKTRDGEDRLRNSFSGAAQNFMTDLNRIKDKTVKDEFLARIDDGIASNESKLKSEASAAVAIQGVIHNSMRMDPTKHISKDSAAFYFISKVLELPKNPKSVLDKVAKKLYDDTMKKSQRPKEKVAAIELMNNVVNGVAENLGLGHVAIDVPKIDKRGDVMSQLPWPRIAKSKAHRGPLTMQEMYRGTNGVFPELDTAMSKLRPDTDYNKYNQPLKAVIGLKENLLVVGRTHSIIMNYDDTSKVKIVRTKDIVDIASPELKKVILDYVKSTVDISVDKVSAKDLQNESVKR
jgi:hypothetical protein